MCVIQYRYVSCSMNLQWALRGTSEEKKNNSGTHTCCQNLLVVSSCDLFLYLALHSLQEPSIALPPREVSSGLWLPFTEKETESQKSFVACHMAISLVLKYHHCKACHWFNNRFWGYKETTILCIHIAYKTHPSVSETLNYMHLERETCILKLRKCGQ